MDDVSSPALNCLNKGGEDKKLYSAKCGVYIRIWYLLHGSVVLGKGKDAAFVAPKPFWDVASSEIWNSCEVSSSGQVWASALSSNPRLAQSLLTKTGSRIQGRRAQEKQNSISSTSDKDLLHYNKHFYYIKPSLQTGLTLPYHKVDCW